MAEEDGEESRESLGSAGALEDVSFVEEGGEVDDEVEVVRETEGRREETPPLAPGEDAVGGDARVRGRGAEEGVADVAEEVEVQRGGERHAREGHPGFVRAQTLDLLPQLVRHDEEPGVGAAAAAAASAHRGVGDEHSRGYPDGDDTRAARRTTDAGTSAGESRRVLQHFVSASTIRHPD